jgi:predicted naringenin-chalcone synthase
MTLATSNLERFEHIRSRTAQILGLGTASPVQSISQHDAALIAQELHITKRWHQARPALYRKSGVSRRGSVLLQSEQKKSEDGMSQRQSFYQPSSSSHPFGPSTSDRMKIYAEEAGPLLVKACLAAIENSSIKPSSITHLVTVSCTGFSAPGSDLRLVETLGLSGNVQRTNVGFMGCHGALNAIRVAKAIVEADAQAVVLVGAVELCSIHQQYTDDPQQLVANALFADGAAAMIVGSGVEGSVKAFSPGNETIGDWTLACSFSQIIADDLH